MKKSMLLLILLFSISYCIAQKAITIKIQYDTVVVNETVYSIWERGKYETPYPTHNVRSLQKAMHLRRARLVFFDEFRIYSFRRDGVVIWSFGKRKKSVHECAFFFMKSPYRESFEPTKLFTGKISLFGMSIDSSLTFSEAQSLFQFSSISKEEHDRNNSLCYKCLTFKFIGGAECTFSFTSDDKLSQFTLQCNYWIDIAQYNSIHNSSDSLSHITRKK